METLLQTALANVLVASLLALAAVAVMKLQSRPALAHALWVLALLKLVTPPLFEVPVTLPGLRGGGQTEPAALPPTEADAGSRVPHEQVAETETAPPAPAPAAEPPSRDASASDALLALACVWGLGAVVVLGFSARRTLAFARLLRGSRTASETLDRQVSCLASRLGIRNAPGVYLVPARVPPMLWSAGSGARIYLPQHLVQGLTARQRITVLLHELAHFRRRDHWVRPLEIIVQALYWWNPLVWWSCRQLKVVEEECCDAWVVWALPRASRTYADTLLKTVEFLSDAKTVVPAAASGIGRLQNLHRRLTMIMEKTTHRSLSRFGRLFTLAVAVATLPALPALAQEKGKVHKEIQVFVEENADHPEKIKELWKKMSDRRARFREEGDEERAREAAVSEQFLREWLEKLHATKRNQEKAAHPGPDTERLVHALKKGVHALKEMDQREEAQLLAHLAERIQKDAEERHQRARHEEELWHMAEKEARDRGRDADLVKIANQRDHEAKRHRQELEEMAQKQEARIKELTIKVEKLMGVVEELAGKMKEAEVRRR